MVRSYCQCTEMDYECDLGYMRSDSGKCSQMPDYQEKFGAVIKEEQAAQCDSFGFYTDTQGYRKIPGNRCYGGLDYNPISFSCTGVPGFSVKNLLIMCIIGLALYFGWPVIEAIIIFLPIPDPKDVLEKIKSFSSKASNLAQKSAGSTKKQGGA